MLQMCHVFLEDILLGSFGVSFFLHEDVSEQSTQHSQMNSKWIKLVRKWAN